MLSIKISFWRDWILSRSKTWWNACMEETTSRGVTLLSKENQETTSLCWQVGFTDFSIYCITNILPIVFWFLQTFIKIQKQFAVFAGNVTDWDHDIITLLIYCADDKNICWMLSICQASCWALNRETSFIFSSVLLLVTDVACISMLLMLTLSQRG